MQADNTTSFNIAVDKFQKLYRCMVPRLMVGYIPPGITPERILPPQASERINIEAIGLSTPVQRRPISVTSIYYVDNLEFLTPQWVAKHYPSETEVTVFMVYDRSDKQMGNQVYNYFNSNFKNFLNIVL